MGFININFSGFLGGKRRNFTAKEKVKFLRKHLLDHTPVSDICDSIKISPTLFYRWQKEFFENGDAAFEKKSGTQKKYFEKKISRLEEKISYKDGVIAEIVQEHIKLKKNLGEL
jgi:transposase